MRQSTTLTIRPPRDFSFSRTVLSHGWYALPPFRYDAATGLLSGTTALDRTTVPWELFEAGPLLRLRIPHTVPPPVRLRLKTVVRSCLRLDEDFAEFHAAMRQLPACRWIARSRSGRLLRAPTVWEDALKLLLTTNCSWALTEAMVGRVMRTFSADGAFPSPEAIARSNERVLRTRCALGYRAPFVLEFARRVAGGSLEIESWRTAGEETDALYAAIRAVRGFGPYAAGNLLKLLGRYDYLGLDSWVRARYAALHAGGRAVSDRTIERRYSAFGRWRGLVFWLEMTRHWHDEKFRRSIRGD
jgi:N-glycosylase/DNA lyase